MTTLSPGNPLALHISAPNDSTFAGYPENPTAPIILVTFKRKVTAKPARWTRTTIDGGSDGQEEMTLRLNPTRFEYTESVKAMGELLITVPDPEYELIDNILLEEDLATDVTVRFGYVEGANMSDPIDMVFYKQSPHFPADGHVETTLVCYDHMIFFTLPFEPTTMEHPEGISINTMVKLVADEVMRAYGRKMTVEFDGHDFDGKWWRMHKVARETVRAPGVHKATAEGERRTAGPHLKVGTPLEFLYGLLRIARSTTTDEPVELFVQNGALFFRPSNRSERRVIANYRYFSGLDPSNPQRNRLLSFTPEVQMKPRVIKTRTLNQETGDVDEAEADNDTEMDRTNLAPKQNTVFRVGIQGGGSAMVEAQEGGTTGDPVGKQSQTRSKQKSYTVKSGDSLDGIAKKLGVPADLLITWNHLTPDGSTNRAKVSLKPGSALKYFLPEPKPSVAKANPNDAASTPTVTTPEQQARANRAYLTDEYKGVHAKATVEGHPKLRAGWPIYIDNVGRKWEGPWYMEEVKHVSDESGYFCELELSRDGFMIAREAGDNSGYDASQDFTNEDPSAPVPVATQEKQKLFRVGIQGGGTAVINK